MPLQIDLMSDDVQLVSDCAEIILYWRGSVFERTKAVEHFYRGALQAIKDSVKWYETESMGEVRPVQAKTFELLPRWLKEPRSRRGMMGLLLESGSNPESSSNLAFSIFCDEEDPQPMGYVRLITPSEILRQEPMSFLQTALYLADALDFESGTAGYAVNWDRRSELSPLAEQHLARIAANYPGVEIPDPTTTLIALQSADRPAFKRVSWITFLGRDLASRVSLSEVDERLGVRVHDLAKGRAVVAGTTPRRSGDLAAYGAVGKLLANVRLREHAPIFGHDEDKTERWLSAFD